MTPPPTSQHPTRLRAEAPPAANPTDATSRAGEALDGQDGSLVSEYGLVAVLGATIAGLAISWARGGAIVGLLDAVLRQVQSVIA